MYRSSKYLNFNWYYKLIKQTVTDNWSSTYTVLICCKTVEKVWHLPVSDVIVPKHAKFDFSSAFREWLVFEDLKG